MIDYSSYGECCVDDVNASHLNTNDMIIHFGRCCLSTASEQSGKQILYVMPRTCDEVIVYNIISVLSTTTSNKDELCVFIDQSFRSLESDIIRAFEGKHLNIGRIDETRFKVLPSVEGKEFNDDRFKVMGRWFRKKEGREMIYIGSNERFSNTLALTLGADWRLR